jgi:nicotinamidase-related amidase
MAAALPKIESRRTALMVMDIQNRIVANYANDPALLTRLKKAIAAARKAKIKIIYVVVSMRDGNPEISARNPTFSTIAKTKAFLGSDPASAIHPAVAPIAGDAVVAKRRVSAFAGSDLDLILRANDIDTLVLTGIATSGVVLSTLRQAADLDYRLLVLSDGCADGDEDVHRVLLTKVFPRQATILTIGEWVAALKSKDGKRTGPGDRRKNR